MEIRALRTSEDRSAFHSGDEAVDRFFHRYAGQNQFRHHIGVTYVAVDDERILGFATVAPRHIDIERLPDRPRKKLPRDPLPALGLVRLAVDTAAPAGVAARLLRFVLRLAGQLADDVGCAGVVVDASPGAVEFYAAHGFAAFDALEGVSEARPQATLMWLPIQQIEAASRARTPGPA
jgi:GNAT superfamily N-acetyltransferase